jgi:peptidyl-dipeptidase Dcp
MKHVPLFVMAIMLLFGGCSQHMDNPLLSEFNTPHGVPPFELIKTGHFMPAFEEGMRQHVAEIGFIIENTQEPTFENTIEAYEYSGETLRRARMVFSNLSSAHTSPELQEVARESAPLISKHWDDIMLNPDLFARIKTVYDQRDEIDLNTEQERLLTETYKSFVRGGANLPADKQERFREINERLSVLTLRFGDNLLAETNNFELILESEEDLAGLPESVISSASDAAEKGGYEGKWLITLHNPSALPFLQYSSRRDLREKVERAYTNKGDNDNEYDNKEIIKEIVALRAERADMLGYETHAEYVLEENMAKNPAGVYTLLNQLWRPALRNARAEARELQSMIDREGGSFKLQPWDWRYYAEKVRMDKYDLDEEMLRAYFPLDSAKDGVFGVINKLWGLQFVERTDVPKYHEEVEVYEVQEADGSYIGILYLDFHPRASKRGGAWMNSFRKQSRTHDGEMIHPIITTVYNFSRPSGDTPALLTYDELTTFFHELGHALHGLLSDCQYNSLSGTAVPRDFVELMSQIMENWAAEPEVLKMFARHYETGDVIPDELIDRIRRSAQFNQGFATAEYLAASFLDMDYHTLTNAEIDDVNAFETKSLDAIGLIPEIVSRYRSTYFAHIFSGGYSAGYYSYIWAEVLDADAFQAFKETSLFDRETAAAFRTHILERGGTEDPMTLYINFRGREPEIEPLLKRRGLQ